ncbi:EamA family transporter [Actinoplanes teichomyceticus]|uniref:Inner membrane transporter RhtA n=1 Tax=Actinoplanes teichomyceticus TaxID=1867 RepID=A0A561VME6_ACTTI|nr:EamA family transporter [Actinoplanes teichomyceticus]TWG12794.1 inner membrane transporter RhtA [Actinoplanes teichomyceticus]GIF13533.1 membrane protein [Actinoplanes teichomyceticus]
MVNALNFAPSAVTPVDGPAVSTRHPGHGTAAAGLVLGAVLSVQCGGAVAALLFPSIGVDGVVALRSTIAALVLSAVCRPRVRGYRRTDWLLIGGFGVALAGMNALFYHAIELIPLGPAVMLEVLGPLVLSVATARRAASWWWAGLAAAGVALLSSTGFDRLTPAGIGFALAAGVMWAGYIMASARVGQRFPKADGLALAMTAAALITLPVGAGTAGATLLSPSILAMGVAVALLCSVLPYTLELLVLRRMPTTTFAVLMSLGPAVAALAGYVVLHQRLTTVEGLAIALVIAANIGAVRTPAPAKPGLDHPRPTA